jgi:biopolymer transport protein ExbD
VRRHFEKFVLLVIFLSISPMIYHVVKAKFSKSSTQVKEKQAA